MSFINHLIKQAKADPPPTELLVPFNNVGCVVAYIQVLTFKWKTEDRDDVRRELLAGHIKMLGIPLLVSLD